MIIFIKNPESKIAKGFLENFKDEISYDGRNYFIDDNSVREAIYYIEDHFKSYKYFLGESSPTDLYVTDSFKLCPLAFSVLRMGSCPDVRKHVNDTIKNESYWSYHRSGKLEGKEWNSIVERLKAKVDNGELSDLDRIENYLREQCSRYYSDYDAEIELTENTSGN